MAHGVFGGGPVIDILIPVLGRPQRVAPLLESIASTTDVEHSVLFLVSKGDKEEIAAVKEAGVSYLTFTGPPAQGQYAKKINMGYRETKGEWLFLAADDLKFYPAWASIALRHERYSVIATNDKRNSFVREGLLATHSFVRRSYIDEQGCSLDGPGIVYHEGYSHNFVDCELSVLARQRGLFAFARNSVVEHMHPVFNRGQMDETYTVGLRDFEQDRSLFCQRMGNYSRDRLVRRFMLAEQQLAQARRAGRGR